MMQKIAARWRQMRDERRKLGWKGFLRKNGPRVFWMLFFAYLVRDLVLYVLIPLAAVAALK